MPKPKIEINWDIVEKRIEAGCSGVEIAANLRIDSDTFYNRFRQHYGKRFQDISADFNSAGVSNIKFTQYMKALAGNNNMLLLLGRERLGQGKLEEIQKSPFEETLEQRHEIMMLKAELAKLKGEHADKPQAE